MATHTYGERLRTYRKLHHVSLMAVAREMGHLSASWTHRRETGATELPRAEFAAAIAAIEAIAERRMQSDPGAVLGA